MPDSTSTASMVEKLEQKLSADWSAIRKARNDTTRKRQDLNELFHERTSPDTSLVVFGSVARQEVTSTGFS